MRLVLVLESCWLIDVCAVMILIKQGSVLLSFVKMKLAFERKRDSYWKFSLDSHDSIIQNDICANFDVEMKDSENDVAFVSQPALVQDVGAALWDLSFTMNPFVMIPTFLLEKLTLMNKNLIRVQQIHLKLK